MPAALASSTRGRPRLHRLRHPAVPVIAQRDRTAAAQRAPGVRPSASAVANSSARAMALPHQRTYRRVMDGSPTNTGMTLVELVFVLLLLGVLLGLASPPLMRGLHRHAVRSARDVIAAELARARTVAVARGGAVLVLDLAGGQCWIETVAGDTAGSPIQLAREFRVDLAVDGADDDQLALRFDGLGIGRMMNRTIRIRRGEAEVGLTLSTHGRVRRW